MVDEVKDIPGSNTFAVFVAKRFSRSSIRFYCLILVAINVALVGARFATNNNGESAFGYPVARDYSAFYVAGKIANDYSYRRAYDLQLQSDVYHELLPREPKDAELPFVNPPFLLIVFSTLARLPYAWSFAVWLIVSMTLYAAGIGLLMRMTVTLPPEFRSLVFPVALAFAPFITYCWGLGQLSSIGVFFLAAAIALESDGRRFMCGLALSACCYKPTLLALIVPMLVLTGRFRALGGFATGSALLLAISWLLVGEAGLREYVHVLGAFGQWKATANTLSQTSLYLDIRTAFKLFSDLHPWAKFVIAGIYLVSVGALAVFWWRLRKSSLVWGLTITWSIVLNVYTPLYDASLLVIPVLLLLDRLYEIDGPVLPPVVIAMLVLLFVLPLGYSLMADRIGFQIYTLLIIGFGLFQMKQYFRVGDRGSPGLLNQERQPAS